VYTNNQIEYLLDKEYVTVVQLPFNLLDNYSLRGDLLEELKLKGKIIHSRSAFLQGLFFKKTNDENIIVYEIEQNVHGIIPTLYNDTWWIVTPFEVLYSKKVLHFKIDAYYVTFFKLNPQFLFVFNKNIKYEVPIVGYIGIDEKDLNKQILMSDINYKKGHFGKGYYFETLEEAYFKALYSNISSTDNTLKLINRDYINETTDITNKTISIKDNKFYLNKQFIGNVPNNCGTNNYVLYKFNAEFIYIKSDTKMKKCKLSYQCATKFTKGF
jgi:hypothetical protein